MGWLVYPIRDLLVWIFSHLLEPIGNNLNNLFLILCFVGIGVWIRFQAKYNAEAEADPNQIK